MTPAFTLDAGRRPPLFSPARAVARRSEAGVAGRSPLKRMEGALRGARDGLFGRLGRRRAFRKLTLDMLGEEVALMTLAAPDHRITFSPHEAVGKQIYLTGDFHRALATRVLAILDRRGLLGGKARVALELGANIGTHTLYLLLSGRFDRVVAAEPDPKNLALLRRNLADNGLAERGTVFPCAVGAEGGEVTLFLDPRNHGASSTRRQGQGLAAISVPLRRVDALLAEAGVAPDDVGLVWMDIEGAEPAALQSMEALTQRRTPIFMEYAPRAYGQADTAALIGRLGAAYERCIFFGDTGETELRVAELPRDVRQSDILLLP